MDEIINDQNNPVAGFSEKEIIKKFHWLQENGMTVDQATETIKKQTDNHFVHSYVESYRNARTTKKQY